MTLRVTAEVIVEANPKYGDVRLRIDTHEGPRAALMPPAEAREIAHALIDAAARAEGIDMPPLCRCAAGERTSYEICHECDDGDRYEEAHRP